MSFLSRRNSRPDKRGDRADAARHADSDYDDYDYAPDDYQREDDNWSPDEYFSPEGIKGRWAAGAQPGERPGGRGHRDAGRGYDDYGGGPDYGSGPEYASGPEYGGGQRRRGAADGYGRNPRQRDSYPQGGSYGTGEYGTGDYATGEYGSGAYDLPEGADDARAGRAGADRAGGGRRRRDRGDRTDWRARLGRRDKDDDIWPDDGVSDEDYWASVAADRPFNSTDDDPLQAADSRPMGRPAGAARPAAESRLMGEPRPATGPAQPGDPRLTGDRPMAGDRPMPAPMAAPVAAEPRTGSGGGRLGPPPGQPGHLAPGQMTPGQMARAGTGPAPARSTTGPNAMRPPTGPSPARPAASHTQPGHTQPGPAQPSFQPNGRGASRQPAAADWADRTERMDRVPAAGYPDPRMNGRTQPPAPARGRADAADRRAPDRAAADRAAAGWTGADDDPLTSKAFSRSALTDTDGRSYRAAHRAPGPADRYDAALSEQTQAFSMPGQYPGDPQAPTGRYPAGGGQPTGRNPYDRETAASYPYPGQPYPSRPAPDSADERYRPARPNGYENGHNGNGHNGNGHTRAGNGGYGGSRGHR